MTGGEDALVLRSRLLADAGFVHGFSLRAGGASEGPFASLNLGRAIGDAPAAVAENTRRFRAAVGLGDGCPLYEAHQVHGRGVVVVDARAGAPPVERVREEQADALATASAVAVGVRTADCVPILLACPRTGAVAAVHAGWRGIVEGVLEAAVEALRALGAAPADLLAAIGPHIRAAAFEVGEEVAAALAAAAPGAEAVHPGAPRPRADLGAAARAQLARLGCARVDDTGGCTWSEPERFFSHRRDAGRTGRHLAVIVGRGRR